MRINFDDQRRGQRQNQANAALSLAGVTGVMKTATARAADPGLIELIASTPAVKKALRDRDEAVTAERTRLIGDLHRLEVEAERETPNLSADVERATENVQKAEAALRAAQQRLGTALIAKHNYGVSFGRRHDEIEAQLRASASPLIAAFVAEMRDAWSKTRRESLVESTAESERTNPRTGRHEQYIKTNVKLVAERLRAIHETIRLAEELATTVADQETIPALLGELASKLPPMI